MISDFFKLLFAFSALTVVILTTISVLIIWADYVQIGDVTWQAIVAVHSVWIATVAAFVSLLAVLNHRMRLIRAKVFRASMLIILPCIVVGGWAIYLQAHLPYHPLNSADDVRPRLKTLLKLEVRNSPQFAEIEDLDRQIDQITISGPGNDFDPETIRYVSFEFDTRCGRVIHMMATLDSGYPDTLNGAFLNYCEK